MLVIVRCVIFEGNRSPSPANDPEQRISHVHEGEVLAAWRATEDRIGVVLLSTTSMATIPSLLHEAFPSARHIDIEDVMPVEAVTPATDAIESPISSDTRQTGT